MGRPGRISANLPNAMNDPVTVSAPNSTSMPSAVMWETAMISPSRNAVVNSATPTSVAGGAQPRGWWEHAATGPSGRGEAPQAEDEETRGREVGHLRGQFAAVQLTCP